MRPIDAIRRRPGMYVGDTDDGRGRLHLVLGLVGNAFDQHLAGRCTRIEVEVGADGWIEVRDDGPGIPAVGDANRSPLAVLVTVDLDLPTADGHRPHVHLTADVHLGIGLAIVNALSEELELITVHDGTEARGRWRRGEPDGDVTTRPTTGPPGTRVRFRPDPTIFSAREMNVGVLLARLDELVMLAPGLTIACTIATHRREPGGLAAQVGRALGDPTLVAAHRATHATPEGPVAVEVAVGWRHPSNAPTIDSFVNYGRSADHGTHVTGLADGIRRSFRGTRAARFQPGLVAAVAVVLADVHWGNPTRDRLITPAARRVVAATTAAALAQWRAAQPDVAAALGRRLSGR